MSVNIKSRSYWTNHFLRAYLPVLLDIPEAQRADSGRYRLSQTEVGVLQEGERELVVLADRNECSGGVKAVCKQEEGEQVGKRVWEFSVLLERQPDLLPTNGDVGFALR